MVYTLRLFHNSNVVGSRIIHILFTGCAKIKRKNSGAKRLIVIFCRLVYRITAARL